MDFYLKSMFEGRRFCYRGAVDMLGMFGIGLLLWFLLNLPLLGRTGELRLSEPI